MNNFEDLFYKLIGICGLIFILGAIIALLR